MPPGLADELVGVREWLARYPASIAAYYRDGESYAEGDTLRQPDLARTLVRVLGDEPLRAALVERASAAVRRYDWSSVTHEVLTVYEMVVEAADAPVREDPSSWRGARLRDLRRVRGEAR